MAQLVVAAAGATVGFMVGGTTGAQIGWALGSAIGSSFTPAQKSEGPRLSDLSVTGTSYGTPIPYVAGHPRVPGQIIWASSKREIATTTRQGGKGGGGGAEQTTYTYEIDLLFLLSSNTIADVTRIWMDGKLIYNILNTASYETRVTSTNNSNWSRLTVYGGNIDQLPDPDYEAAVGTANAPAYRGRGTLFIKSLQLGSSGNLPNLTFEITQTPSIIEVSTSTQKWQDFHISDTTNRSSPTFDDSGFDTYAGPIGFTSTPNDIEYFSLPPIDNFSIIYDKVLWYRAQLSSNFSTVTQVIVYSETPCTLYLNGTVISPISTTINYWVTKPSRVNEFGLGFPDVYVGPYYGEPNALGQAMVDARDTVDNTFILGYTSWSYNENNGAFYASGTALPSYPSPVGLAAMYATRIYTTTYNISISPTPSTVAVTTKTTPAPPGIDYFAVVVNPTGTQALSGEVYKAELREVVDVLLWNSGMLQSQWDTSDLGNITNKVNGMAITNVSTTRTVLEMLASAYHFDAVLSDKIYFRRRSNNSSVATLTLDDLGNYIEKSSPPDPLPIVQLNELEIPAQMAITYSNINGDYQNDTQYSDRLLTGMESIITTQLPLVFTPSEVKKIVDALLLDKTISATTIDISLNIKHSFIEPGDILVINSGQTISNKPLTYRTRVIKKHEQDNVTKLSCSLYDSSVFSQGGTTEGLSSTQSGVSPLPSTTLFCLDISLLRDSDNTMGHYIVVSAPPTGWPGAAIYESYDNITFIQNSTINTFAISGSCASILPNWTGGNEFDEVSTLLVNVGDFELVSYTREEVLADQQLNVALVGNEILQFRTATLQSPGVYLLNSFIRGRRGTSTTGHIAAERFVILSGGGVKFIPLSATDIGRLRYYKVATFGQLLTNVTSQSITPNNVLLKPFAPVGGRANRDSSDTIILWDRQTRLSVRFGTELGGSYPLGENSESYVIEIYSNSSYTTLLRTLTSVTESVTYTAAQQNTDFGSVQTTLYVKIYQSSTVVGRGYPFIGQI